jgi:hypothetical protein
MFTSCGWFFSDISGIETVQNLRYAARAIDLAAPFAPVDLEAMLMADLAQASSNVAMHKNGRVLWERQVRPARVGAQDAAARLLMEGVLGRIVRAESRYRWALVPDPVERAGEIIMAGIRATSEVTAETLHFAGVCRRDGAFDFLAGIAPWPAAAGWLAFVEEAKAAFTANEPQLAAWSSRCAARLLRLRHFLPDEQHALLRELLTEVDASLAKGVSKLSEEALSAAEAMASVGMPLPTWLKGLLEAYWSRRFTEDLAKLQGTTNPAAYTRLMDAADRARHLGLTLDLATAAARLGETLMARMDAIADDADADAWQAFLELLQLASRLSLRLPEEALQDRLFTLLRGPLPGWVSALKDIRDTRYQAVSAVVAVATRLNLRTEEIRAHLAPLEAPVAADPTYWP